MSRLERLLQSIDPTITLDPLSQRVDHTINTFPLQTAVITKWDDFVDCIARFVNHADNVMLRLTQPLPMEREMDWGRGIYILTQLYGFSGDKAAFEMARTGNEGGLYQVLKRIALKMAEKHSNNEIQVKINLFWEHLTLEEEFEIIDEYLRKYGHLLPTELTEGSAARIKAHFPKVLAEHPYVIQKVHRFLTQ